MIDFLVLALRVAWETVTYLLAYLGAPVWAFVASVSLYRVSDGWEPGGWLEDARSWRRAAGATLLGICRPGWRPVLEGNLRRLRGPTETVAFLASSHALTLYYLLLLGPLLGKDVLLSHLVGVAWFLLFGALGARLLGFRGPGEGDGGGPGGRTAEPERDATGGTVRALALEEVRRVGGVAAYGLLLGSVVAAWGLTGPRPVPATIVDPPLLGQGLNALLGVVTSVVAWMWPVSNLFVGTYLWKVGLAHAGLVAFFLASTISPQRVKLYADVFGRGRALRLATALLLGAILAGVATALLFGVAGIGIRYKLVPGQMWTP